MAKLRIAPATRNDERARLGKPPYAELPPGFELPPPLEPILELDEESRAAALAERAWRGEDLWGNPRDLRYEDVPHLARRVGNAGNGRPTNEGLLSADEISIERDEAEELKRIDFVDVRLRWLREHGLTIGRWNEGTKRWAVQ